MKNFIDEKNICCPSCGKHNFTDIRVLSPVCEPLKICSRLAEEL